MRWDGDKPEDGPRELCMAWTECIDQYLNFIGPRSNGEMCIRCFLYMKYTKKFCGLRTGMVTLGVYFL